MSDLKLFDDLSVKTPGRAPLDNQITDKSRYNDPIDTSEGRLAGNSRKWGDVSIEVQQDVIKLIIDECKENGLSDHRTAIVLSIARQESGFNPDAAVGQSSAAGIGQFTKDTAKDNYPGLNSNIFDAETNIEALVQYIGKIFGKLESKGKTGEEFDALVYKYHHDGFYSDNSNASGGLDISKQKVVPKIELFENKLKLYDTFEQINNNDNNVSIHLDDEYNFTVDTDNDITAHEAIEYVNSIDPTLKIDNINTKIIDNNAVSFYTIKSGDTLSAIAESNDISLDDLLSANPNITNPNQINIGDQITLPTIDISSYFIEYNNPLKEILDNFISDMDKILEDNQWLIEGDRIGANEDYFLLKEDETFTITIDPIKSGSYYIEDGIKTQFYFDFAGKTISKNDIASNSGWTTIDWSATTALLQLDWASFNIQQIDGANLYEYDGSTTIDNGSLDLNVRTDWDKDFASEEGFVIGDADWFAYMPDNYVNGDGWHNVWGAGNVSDWYRPANYELSYFETPQLLSDVQNQFNLLLGSKTIMADISNYYSDAFNYLNIDPLILDLNGDGVKLISYENSNVVFDVDNDQYAERTGWVSAQDGILVHDKNGDGIINDITETISEYYVDNVTDGLQALKTLDSNNDNLFDKNDTMWDILQVWQDINSDGITDENELKTLDTLGIKSINLNGEITDREKIEGNPVLSKSTMTMTNGATREVAAVDFKTNPIGYEWNNINLGIVATSENKTATLLLENSAYVKMSEIDNITTVYGSAGADTIIGTDKADWIFGGAGSDKLSGGAGDDLIIIDAEDLQENIDGGEGRDILLITGAAGVHFNLTQSNIEVATGGAGSDILIAGGAKNAFIDGAAGDDLIIGGLADDSLAGGDGNDKIDGAYGDDIIRGHRGNDNLAGGLGDDYIDAGLGADALYGNKGNDILIGGDGEDIIDGGDGFDIAKYKGSYANYDIIKEEEGFKVTDIKTGDSDQLKNIERIRFDNVTIGTDADIFLPANDIIEINSDKQSLFINSEQLMANDKNIGDNQLQLLDATNPIGGTVELKIENGKTTGVIFTPDNTYVGVMTFDYSITNSAGQIINVTQRDSAGAYIEAPIKASVRLRTADDPDDPLYYDQWYLQEIGIKKVWENYTGKGVKIGIFEAGDINYTHTDLDNNISADYKKELEYNETENFAKHATMVAGVIAAEKNQEGSIGVAYDAEISGWSWDPYGDKGLYQIQNVDIANNSWSFETPFQDNFTNEHYSAYHSALNSGVLYGRNELGTIVIVAAGNNREQGDNVNYHNISSFRSVITVGSINQEEDIGKLINASTPFSNPGAAILVSAPGSNINSTSNLLYNQNGSTFQNNFETIEGTSFSAPIVSGITALMLEANPHLGYRDVQHILAYTARQFQDQNTQWQTNGASDWNGGGLHFSADYGFGIVNALAAVRLAETWNQINYADNEYYIEAYQQANIAIQDNKTITDTILINNDAITTEHIEVTLDITHQRIGDLIISLTSPNGTESVLLNRPGKAPQSDNTDAGLETENLNFTFTTVNLWGENSFGEWKLQITDANAQKIGTLNSWDLSLYGKYNSGNDTYIYTDQFANLAENNRQTLTDDNGGIDTINIAAITENVNFNLTPGSTSQIAGKSLTIAQNSIIEYLLAGDGNDTLTGNSADNFLYAGRGNDAIYAGDGNDTINGKQGADLIQAGDGDDTIIYSADSEAENGWYAWNIGSPNNIINGEKIPVKPRYQTHDVIDGGTGNDTIQMTDQSEALFLHDQYSPAYQTGARIINIETIYAGAGNDIIDLTSDIYLTSHITVYGEAGNDVLWTSEGDDIIYGGKGEDAINGGIGNDTINGGAGKDDLFGSIGSDLFDFSNIDDSTTTNLDTIQDFEQGEDQIDISNLFDDSDLGDSLYCQIKDGNTLIEDHDSDFAIKIIGEFDLTYDDFIF